MIYEHTVESLGDLITKVKDICGKVSHNYFSKTGLKE